MENPYESPQGSINLPVTSSAPLTWKQILFSFEGRVPRRLFWGVSIANNAVSKGVEKLCEYTLEPPISVAVFLLASVPTTWVALAITAKRLHDRDMSGWWVLLPFVFAFAFGVVAAMGKDADGFLIITLAFVVVCLVFLIICGFLRGTVGPNQYGGDPT